MTNAKEDVVERMLRWMKENVNGAYLAKHPEAIRIRESTVSTRDT